MSKLTHFINHVGQAIIAEEVENTSTHLVVKNPAILHVSAGQAGNQLQVQLIPLLFKEFVNDKQREEGVNFTFSKANIVTSNADLDARISEQFTRVNSRGPEVKTGNDKPVIKLFDD